MKSKKEYVRSGALQMRLYFIKYRNIKSIFLRSGEKCTYSNGILSLKLKLLPGL